MKTFPPNLNHLLRSSRRQKTPVLGVRELAVMKILWRGETLSAQEVLNLSSHNNLSLSTIQSTLERLYRKELVFRKKSGRSYLYQPAVSRSAMITQLLGDIAEQISDGEMAPMISGFMNLIDQEIDGELATELRNNIKTLPKDSKITHHPNKKHNSRDE